MVSYCNIQLLHNKNHNLEFIAAGSFHKCWQWEEKQKAITFMPFIEYCNMACYWFLVFGENVHQKCFKLFQGSNQREDQNNHKNIAEALSYKQKGPQKLFERFLSPV